jgi:ketosteroid isomerase-like protein
MRIIRPAFLAGTLAVALMLVPHTAQAQDAKTEVTKASEAFEVAYNANDGTALASLYSADAVVMPPGAEPASGGAAIKAMFATPNPAGITMDLKIKDLMVSGDLVVETGGWTATDPAGAHLDHGTYLAVWKKMDGGWKMIRDTWNSSMTQ